jgi:hypothetical protein
MTVIADFICALISSWPGPSRPSTSLQNGRKQGVDARHKAGHDEGIKKIPAASAAGISYRIATAMSYFKTSAVNG